MRRDEIEKGAGLSREIAGICKHDGNIRIWERIPRQDVDQFPRSEFWVRHIAWQTGDTDPGERSAEDDVSAVALKIPLGFEQFLSRQRLARGPCVALPFARNLQEVAYL